MITKTPALKLIFLSGIFITNTLCVTGCYTYRQEVQPPSTSIAPLKSSVPASSKTAVLSAQNLTSTERAQALTERMKTTLNLTAAQTSEVSKINLDYASRIDKVMNSDQSTLDKKTEFKRLSAVKRIEIKDLLTEPQKQLYDAHKKELLDTY